jgi:hypothetical protein
VTATLLVVVLARPAIAADGGTVPFARAGEVPERRFYARLDDIDGRADPRWRRKRDGEFQVDELSDGTVLRVRRIVSGAIVEDHRYDAGGWPLVTVFYGPGGAPDHAQVHAVPEQTVPLSGWTFHALPGSRIAAPTPPVDLPGGSVRLQALDGELDVWTGSTADPWSDGFREGLVAGCGCTIGDRATAWVDGRPGVRYRLMVPDAGPPRPVDLWAVPQGDGMWLATFRAGAVPAEGDPDATLLAGRVLLALVSFDTEPT